MAAPVIQVLAGACLVLAALGLVYLAAALIAVRGFCRRPAEKAETTPAATILKPLRGADPELYANLLSFRRQAYPEHQLVLGVADAEDEAVSIARRLIADEPGADIALVVEPRSHGRNHKVGNLLNMLPAARHDILVIADSDMRALPGYLRQVLAPLDDPAIGVVTCLYVGKPVDGRLWSSLGAAFINHHFLPMALLGRLLGEREGCFGATIAFRRADLEAAGGLGRIADLLADDHALGQLVCNRGKRIHLSRNLVTNMVHEPSLAALFAHELRWSRTIRAIAPASHLGTVVTHPLALSLLASLFAWTTPLTPIALAGFGVILAFRFAQVRATERILGLEPAPLRNVPLRDVLSFVVWCASFWGKSVRWRGQEFRIEADGRLV
ncbi:MAG: bacteriohopanetetrol glucosamine biosynthesis glycosyltransferase HpnI [Proteobacteria bacterium]|nr:bacteriohopanetetrol glucosamine biosynthesis glycosyltransferase HpnI [Pseudomonadota bacterium]MBI3499072.1 bacteriohopanetetrol glucosamine biosynthesis glycosyltransferase HpnI [Pseudomonadota bacterium]